MGVMKASVPINLTQAELTELIVLIKSHTTSRSLLRDTLVGFERARAHLKNQKVRLVSDSIRI